jgi:hypothetical protein
MSCLEINWAESKAVVEYSYVDLECSDSRLYDTFVAHASQDLDDKARQVQSTPQCENFRIEETTILPRMEKDRVCEVDFCSKIVAKCLAAIGNKGGEKSVACFQTLLLEPLNSIASSYEDALTVMRWLAELRFLPWQIAAGDSELSEYQALLLKEDSPWYFNIEEKYLYEYFPEEEEATEAVLASQIYGCETGLEYISPTKHNLVWTKKGFLLNFGLYDLKEEEILLQLDDYGLYVHWSAK